jgi:hypothetical protein
MNQLTLNQHIYTPTRLSVNNHAIDQLTTGCVEFISGNDANIGIDDHMHISNPATQQITAFCHKIKIKPHGKQQATCIFFSILNSKCKYEVVWRAYSNQPVSDLIYAILQPANWQIQLLSDFHYNCEWLQADETCWQTFLRLCSYLNIHFIFEHQTNGKTIIKISSDINTFNKYSTVKIDAADTIQYKVTNSASANKVAINLHNSLHGGRENYQASISISDSSDAIIYRKLSAASKQLADLNLLEQTSRETAKSCSLSLQINSNLEVGSCIIFQKQCWRIILKKTRIYKLNPDCISEQITYKYLLQPAHIAGIARTNKKLKSIGLRIATIKTTLSYAENSYLIYYDDPQQLQSARAVNLWTEQTSDSANAGAVLYKENTKVIIVFLYNDPAQPVIIGCSGLANSKYAIEMQLGSDMRFYSDDQQVFSNKNAKLIQNAHSVEQTAHNMRYSAQQITSKSQYKYSRHCKNMYLQAETINHYADKKILHFSQHHQLDCAESNIFAQNISCKINTGRLSAKRLNCQAQTLQADINFLSLKAKKVTISSTCSSTLGTSNQIMISQAGISCTSTVLCAGVINV